MNRRQALACWPQSGPPPQARRAHPADRSYAGAVAHKAGLADEHNNAFETMAEISRLRVEYQAQLPNVQPDCWLGMAFYAVFGLNAGDTELEAFLEQFHAAEATWDELGLGGEKR